MRDEANLCYKRGDQEDGDALANSIFDQLFPGLVEETKRNPTFVYELIALANTEKNQMKADHYRSILVYLKNKGVKF